MDWACSTHREDEIRIQHFSLKTSTEETTWTTDVDWRIISESLRNSLKMRTGLEWLRIEPNLVSGFCERCNNASGFLKQGIILIAG
jgi:hypothetical protein